MRNAVYVGGTYKHYKGNTYIVLSVARNTETGEQFVIYKLHREKDETRVFARPAKNFLDVLEDGRERFHRVRGHQAVRKIVIDGMEEET